ncbi:hypothetical protein SELMODRAFT_407903 [Selaginella moellendorffii]|uniref:Uncharacterized protein n=1 Tax=Selaginella moellendorffii TaxID=88036 RepID=D8R552_SELML|nr:uncharacterized protein LOC9634335 isoform X1 [Selaginella moellendorffii]EFJ32783.1 hypothetical protein SELMODRAFT_407903 [Selaginella moellendorffii]|eukprot:XP_002966756.1 uncharacterized protein LOC9634335 isoform X1 [Selaginella moellendorffii]
MEDEDYVERQGKRLTKRQKLMEHLNKLPVKSLQAMIAQLAGAREEQLFAIPPSDIKEADFRMRYGLIKIKHYTPSYDRFAAVEMSGETLHCVNRLIANDVAYSTAFQGDCKGEMQVAPILDRMLRNLGRFTRPRELEKEPACGQSPDPSSPSDKKADFVLQYEADKEDLKSQVVQVDEENLPNSQSSDSSADYPLIKPQSASSPRHHSDCKMYVYTNRYTLRGLRLKVTVDFRRDAGVEDLYRPAMYTIQELVETAARPKSYRPPVTIMAGDKNDWYYGILEIDGFVWVENHQIDQASLQEFPEEKMEVNPKKFTPSFTRAELQNNFEAWKKDLAKIEMRIPNGLHPVGRFFIRTVQGYNKMPTLGGEAELARGQKRFYDGMLKTLVGRQVTNWSPQDALNAWNARKCLLEIT